MFYTVCPIDPIPDAPCDLHMFLHTFPIRHKLIAMFHVRKSIQSHPPHLGTVDGSEIGRFSHYLPRFYQSTNDSDEIAPVTDL